MKGHGSMLEIQTETLASIILVATSSVFLPGRGCEGGRLTENRLFHR